MKQDEMIVLALAGVAVLLVLKQTAAKTPAKAGTGKTFQAWTPLKGVTGTSYSPLNPGAFIGTQDLINGTIEDYYSGDSDSYAQPTVKEIVNNVIGADGGGFRVGYW